MTRHVMNSPLFAAVVLAICSLRPCLADASTYYVDPSAIQDTGDGSANAPKKHITSGIRLMKSGDILILKDGVYRGQNNMIGDDAIPRIFPPSGTPDNPTTIRAEHVGGAIIDGDYARAPFSSVNKSGSKDYVHVDGIHFRRGKTGVFNIKGTRNRITNCGFEDGIPPTSDAEAPIAFIAGGSSYTLVEDCWVWGKGRYGFYTSSTDGGTDHIIFRRVVVRLDDTPAGRITAGLRFYKGHTNTMQNCVVIDSRISPTAGAPAAFSQGGGSSDAEPDHAYNGVIALNNPGMKGFVPEDGARTNTLANSILWGNADGVFTVKAYSPPFALDLSGLTIGANPGYAVRSNSGYAGMTVRLSGSLIHVPGGGIAFKDPTSVTMTAVHIEETGTRGSNTQGFSTIDRTDFRRGLKYLTRVEPGSLLATKGMGASVLYQAGQSGSLYGSPGWDALTRTPLWPFSYERLWADKMRSYTASGTGGNRGFAAVDGPTPLTDYVWGYLGNTVPPFNLKASPGSGKVRLEWNAVHDPDISGYKVYVGTSSGKYDFADYAGGRSVGNVTSTTINGLANGTAYYFAVTTVTRKKDESGYSYEMMARPKSFQSNHSAVADAGSGTPLQ